MVGKQYFTDIYVNSDEKPVDLFLTVPDKNPGIRVRVFKRAKSFS
jgi:hypothetical protein